MKLQQPLFSISFALALAGNSDAAPSRSNNKGLRGASRDLQNTNGADLGCVTVRGADGSVRTIGTCTPPTITPPYDTTNGNRSSGGGNGGKKSKGMGMGKRGRL